MNYLRSEMSLPVATIRMRSVQMVFLAFVTVSFLCTKHSLAMADGVCPEQIAQTCECFPSMQLVRCVNKDLAQYPELKTIQVNIQEKICDFLHRYALILFFTSFFATSTSSNIWTFHRIT